MASVRKLLIENGLGRIAAQAEAAVKYSAELSIGKPGEGNTHRLGGRPNLPPTLEWPMWRDSPLAFVAQIELSQLPVIEGLDLPRIGSLYFFSRAEGMPGGSGQTTLVAPACISRRGRYGCTHCVSSPLISRTISGSTVSRWLPF